MAIVSIIVHPNFSPRLVEIPYPEIEITMQDLVDSVRDWEDREDNMGYEYIIDASGKQDLEGGLFVGITVSLNNAQVMFTGRTTPLDDGSGRTCDNTDTDGRQLYVDDADFVTDTVASGDVVMNVTTGEMAAILEVTDQYTLEHLPLSGEGGLGWTSGDNYKVFHNAQCKITGGNIVAVDDVDASISPLFQTPFTQVIIEKSTSAALVQGSGGLTAEEVADTVWDELLEDHKIVKTFGDHVRRIKNQRI